MPPLSPSINAAVLPISAAAISTAAAVRSPSRTFWCLIVLIVLTAAAPAVVAVLTAAAAAAALPIAAAACASNCCCCGSNRCRCRAVGGRHLGHFGGDRGVAYLSRDTAVVPGD